MQQLDDRNDMIAVMGRRVRQARLENKMHLEELGEALNPKLSYQQIQKYEMGVNRLPSVTLAQVAKVLKRPLKWFFTEDDDAVTEGDEAVAVAELAFIQAFNALAKVYHRHYRACGMWDGSEGQSFATKIAKCHAELSEALEAHRCQDAMDDKLTDRRGTEVELSDALRIIMDMSVGFKLDVAGAAVDKFRYDLTRPYLHGKDY